MSIHPSLRGADALKGDRSVLTRFERIMKLQRDGKLDAETASAYGLPKVRTKFKVARTKRKSETKEGAEASAAEGAESAGAEAVEAGEEASAQRE